jgi:hypothetical protein
MLKPTDKIQVKMGRPPKYNAAMVKTAEEYLQKCVDSDETPFIEELALQLGVWDDTMRTWEGEKGKEDFAAVMARLRSIQKLDIKRKSLKGKYVSKIATLILSADHGVVPVYRQEMSGLGGKPIEVQTKLSPEQEKLLSDGITKVFETTMK